MANENKINEEVNQNPDLETIMKEGLQQFDIPPEQKPTESAAASQSAAAPVKKEDADTKEMPPEKKVEPPPAQAEAKRFTSHEEAEKGYKNLQSEFTRVTTELKETKGKLTAQELAEKQSKVVEAATLEFEKFATDRRTKLLDEIDALDPDDKDYRTKVAQAQARTDKDILTAGQKIAVAATITEAPLPPVKPAAATSADDQNRTGSVVEYTKKIIAAPEIGLDPDDVLFWIFAGQAPDRNAAGKNIPLDEQIKWAVDQTKQYHSKITPPIDKKKEIADAAVVAANNQQAEMPLSRTTARVPVTDDAENNKPLSLSDAIDSANDLRRL